jgi:hypothetical protein
MVKQRSDAVRYRAVPHVDYRAVNSIQIYANSGFTNSGEKWRLMTKKFFSTTDAHR